MYMGDMDMCGCEGFSSSLIWDRVYKPESLGLEQGIILPGNSLIG